MAYYVHTLSWQQEVQGEESIRKGEDWIVKGIHTVYRVFSRSGS